MLFNSHPKSVTDAHTQGVQTLFNLNMTTTNQTTKPTLRVVSHTHSLIIKSKAKKLVFGLG